MSERILVAVIGALAVTAVIMIIIGAMAAIMMLATAALGAKLGFWVGLAVMTFVMFLALGLATGT